MKFDFDGARLLRVCRRAGTEDLEVLGIMHRRSPTREGLAALADTIDPVPSWMGFEVRRWPGAVADRERLVRPVEHRRVGAPTLDYLEVLAGEAAVALALSNAPAHADHVRDASREAILNAVVHRDYEVDAPIRVDQYLDALEVTSPGRAEHAEIADGHFSGRGARSPGLQFTLQALGYGSGQGVGWGRAVALARTAGLDLRATLRDQHVIVTLAVDAPRRVGLLVAGAQGREMPARLPAPAWEDRVLRLLSDERWWRPKDIQHQLDIPRSTLNALLKRLESRGVVERSHQAQRSSRQSWRLLGSPTIFQASNTSFSGSEADTSDASKPDPSDESP